MKTRKNPNTRPRRVDFANNHQDHWCLILAMRGRSNKAIIAETKLTPGQISYRLRETGVKRMEYRDGLSPFARAVDNATEKLAEAALLKHLRTHMKGDSWSR